MKNIILLILILIISCKEQKSNDNYLGIVNIEITGDDFDELVQISENMENFINESGIKGIEKLKANLETGKPELIVDIDRDKARRFGLSTSAIGSEIRTALFGKEISKFKQGEEDYAIQLRLMDKYRYDVDALMNKSIVFRDPTDGKMHIPTISTIQSIELIKEAKAKGLQVTCSVAVHQLVLTDDKLEGFDSRYKVAPPLRDEATRKALINAVIDGTIDCITSDHNPLDIEHKKLEFDLAKDGTIGLESAFGTLQTVLPLEVIIEKLTSVKSIFGIEENTIEVGSTANLSLFNIKSNWTFTKENILSKSKNSAFLGQTMKGKALGIYNNNTLIL